MTTEEILRAERDSYSERIDSFHAAMTTISKGGPYCYAIANAALDNDLYLAEKHTGLMRRRNLRKSFTEAIQGGCITDAMIGGKE
jgi:hypothetical protein